MKLKIILSVCALIIVAALVYAYLQMHKERGAESQGETPVSAEAKTQTGTKGETVLALDEKTQKLIDLETVLLTPATLPPEIKCYGRVLDSSPLIALLSNVASARAALDASAKEFQRVKALYTQGENASARTLEVAEVATKRDQVAVQAAEAQLMAAWGKSVADQPELPGLVQSLSSLQEVIIRLDLPVGEMTTEKPLGARLVLPANVKPMQARFLGLPTSTEPQVQGQGFLFLATNTPTRLSPGLALTGFLQMPGEPLHGVTVPEAAVVRSAERAWVYVQIGSTNFTRREFAQDHPVADGWFVTSGLQPNDRVATTGAQALLSEERKGEIQVGD